MNEDMCTRTLLCAYAIQVDLICHACVLEFHLMKFILVPCFHMKSECPLTPNQTMIEDLNEVPNPPPPISQRFIKTIVTRS